MTLSRPRSVAVMRTAIVPSSDSGEITEPSPLRLPATWPSWPSRKPQ
jgi:hypothetical protein